MPCIPPLLLSRFLPLPCPPQRPLPCLCGCALPFPLPPLPPRPLEEPTRSPMMMMYVAAEPDGVGSMRGTDIGMMMMYDGVTLLLEDVLTLMLPSEDDAVRS